MTKQTVKGFKDFLGEEARKRKKIIKIIEDNFTKYGFEPAETPIVEFEEFVTGGNKNDEAVRDVFRLKDRGERELALRYEFTFQLKRIAQKQKLPFKRFQIGSVFRDEPIKKGRLRQFIQCDADIIGSSNKDEAECLAMTQKIFDELGIKIKILINNRKLLNEILAELKIKDSDKEQVLREIDKLEKSPINEIAKNLSKYNAERILDILNEKEAFFEKYSAYKEIKQLKEFGKLYGLKTEFKPNLARGLSYYNGSVFEIVSDEINVSIAGGGSYLIDGMQATGISLGLEPIFLISKIQPENINYLIVSLEQDKESIKLAEKLRKKSSVQLLLDKSIGKAMEYANSKNIENVIIVGEKEVKAKKFKAKNMKTGKEKEVKV
jgi:histidyl-tRNA synthetase